MKNASRWFWGYFTMMVGILLMAFAAYLVSEEHTTMRRHAAATITGVSGGVITFVVARRILTSAVEA